MASLAGVASKTSVWLASISLFLSAIDCLKKPAQKLAVFSFSCHTSHTSRPPAFTWRASCPTHGPTPPQHIEILLHLAGNVLAGSVHALRRRKFKHLYCWNWKRCWVQMKNYPVGRAADDSRHQTGMARRRRWAGGCGSIGSLSLTDCQTAAGRALIA